MKAACKIQYTFNWFFINREHIAYFNSGINPVRSTRPPGPADPREVRVAGLDAASAGAALRRPDRPSDVDPRTNISDQEPCRRTRRSSTSATSRAGTTSRRRASAPPTTTSRCGPCSARSCSTSGSSRGSRARRRSTPPKLVDAMEDAGTVDLRGDVALPWALKLIGKSGERRGPRRGQDPARVDQTRGAHRRDKNARRRLRPGRGGPDHGRLVAALARGRVQAGARRRALRRDPVR